MTQNVWMDLGFTFDIPIRWAHLKAYWFLTPSPTRGSVPRVRPVSSLNFWLTASWHGNTTRDRKICHWSKIVTLLHPICYRVSRFGRELAGEGKFQRFATPVFQAARPGAAEQNSARYIPCGTEGASWVKWTRDRAVIGLFHAFLEDFRYSYPGVLISCMEFYYKRKHVILILCRESSLKNNWHV